MREAADAQGADRKPADGDHARGDGDGGQAAAGGVLCSTEKPHALPPCPGPDNNLGTRAERASSTAGTRSSRMRESRRRGELQAAAALGAAVDGDPAAGSAFSAFRRSTSSVRISSAAFGFSLIHWQAFSRPWAMRSPFHE